MRSTIWFLMTLWMVVLWLGSGCAHFDPQTERREQHEAFTNALWTLSAPLRERPLSLDDCISIAMTNNYEVRLADLRAELRRIGKNVAFTAFLPNVAAKAGYSAYSKTPNPMTETRYSSASLEIGMPIFMPATWFLFASARHGHAAAEIEAFYVRQNIVLQTSIDYFEVLVQQDTVTALESQLQATREYAGRIEGLAREGFFRAWEADQARFQVETRQSELNRARRRLTVVRGELLTGLGLPPDAPIALSGDIGEGSAPTNALPDLVLRALERHPTLALADREVVMKEHGVRQAFCEFLPTLSLFSTGNWTGNDLAEQASYWLSGLQGIWDLFDGLANVARFKAAQVERRQSELQRESTFLTVMIQVIATEAAWRDAAEEAALRGRAHEVAAARYADYDARAREGLMPLSEALDARSAMDLAQLALVRARYQERIALSNLALAMGATPVPETKDLP